MLSINNQVLPVPSSLTYILFAPLSGGGTPTLLRAQAQWQALTPVETALVCGLAGGSFTLACRDPRTDAWRGFPAHMAACDIRVLEAQAGAASLLRLTLIIDESQS